MILGFKPQFVAPTLAGIKIHTIREDRACRWEPGRIIHFATGTRSKNYRQFMQGKCTGVQAIQIKYFSQYESPQIRIGHILLSESAKEVLAFNDGFTTTEAFYQWFNKDFTGVIIHWTNRKY